MGAVEAGAEGEDGKDENGKLLKELDDEAQQERERDIYGDESSESDTDAEGSGSEQEDDDDYDSGARKKMSTTLLKRGFEIIPVSVVNRDPETGRAHRI